MRRGDTVRVPRLPLLTLAALTALAAALAACTDDGSEPLARSTTTASSGEVVDGGWIRLGLPGPPVIDPALANPASPSDLMVLDVLYDGLVRTGSDGELQPALAESWRDDGEATAWAFVLDPDATFASGRAITVADVIASIERVARGGAGSLAALRLEPLTGFAELASGQADHLAGLSESAPGELHIALDSPLGTLPEILAAPEFGVVDTKSLDAAVDSADAIAGLDLSGSWALAAVEDDVVELERREGTEGHLDGIELRSYADGDAAYDTFDAGELDWALVPVDRHDDAVEEHGDEHFAPFHAELFFGMRTAGPNLSRLELRQAIAAAIDTEAIAEAVYADLADPLDTVVPAGVPGHDADRCGDCGYDPDRAEDLLAAAFPDGAVPTVNIDFDESPAQQEMAELIAADLKAVGIPTALRPKPLDEYKAFVVSGAQELFSFGWIGGYPSPDAYLAPLFASAANDNLTGYREPTVDAALVAARGGDDSAAEHWANVEARVLGDAVVVPVVQFRTQAVASSRVRGLEHAVDATVDWSAVWLTDRG